MAAIVHTAVLQYRVGGVLLMSAVFGAYPFPLKLYADSGYQGARGRSEAGLRPCERADRQTLRGGLVSDANETLIVERTIGWLNRCRRLETVTGSS